MIVLDGIGAVRRGRNGHLGHHAENENYVMPEMPAGADEGIIRGIYKLSTTRPAAKRERKPRVRLLGSGAILPRRRSGAAPARATVRRRRAMSVA